MTLSAGKSVIRRSLGAIFIVAIAAVVWLMAQPASDPLVEGLDRKSVV